MAERNTNGWNRYQKVVLFRLDQQDQQLSALGDKLDKLTSSVTVLKVKMAFIGMVSGLFSGATVTAFIHRFIR